MTGDQITWEEGPFGGGTLHGKIRNGAGVLFKTWTLAWAGTHDGNPGYRLSCHLPGIKTDVRVESVAAGKRRAERQLGTFLGWFDRRDGIRDSDVLAGHAGGIAVVVEESLNVVLVDADSRRVTVTDVSGLRAHLAVARTMRDIQEKKG